MASTYTNRLGLEKQTDGENPNSWGAVLNTNVIDLIDDAIAGYEIVSVSGTGITLTDNQGSTDQSRNAALEFAGTLTAIVTITVPSEEKTYFIRENTTGSFAVQMKTVGGTAEDTRIAFGSASQTLTSDPDFEVVTSVSGGKRIKVENGGIQIANMTVGASLATVGSMRYRAVTGVKNFSYVDMVMQTAGTVGAVGGTYVWVNIVQNSWT